MRKVFRRSGKEAGASGTQENTSGDEEARDAYFELGISLDCNKRYRKSMEDSHSYVLNYLDIPGCAYFGLFDGHAGPQCAQYCAEHLHGILAKILSNPSNKLSIPEALAKSFNQIDKRMDREDIKNSGCTAVVAISCSIDPTANKIVKSGSAGSVRKLFVANVGDARAVLLRDLQSATAARALRLTYDHRGSDPHEQKRISHAGGILMGNRVNGVLAVTRSLGDLYMKDYVIGDPFTTETDLIDGDCVVIACDGLWDVCSDKQALGIVRSQLNGLSGAHSSNASVKDNTELSEADNLSVDSQNSTNLASSCSSVEAKSGPGSSKGPTSTRTSNSTSDRGTPSSSDDNKGKAGVRAIASSRALLDHALSSFSADNVTVMMIKLN